MFRGSITTSDFLCVYNFTKHYIYGIIRMYLWYLDKGSLVRKEKLV